MDNTDTRPSARTQKAIRLHAPHIASDLDSAEEWARSMYSDSTYRMVRGALLARDADDPTEYDYYYRGRRFHRTDTGTWMGDGDRFFSDSMAGCMNQIDARADQIGE